LQDIDLYKFFRRGEQPVAAGEKGHCIEKIYALPAALFFGPPGMDHKALK
jgi:hypothetical protein